MMVTDRKGLNEGINTYSTHTQSLWMSLRPNLQPSLTKNSIESNFESDLTFSTFSRPIFDDFGCPNPPKMNGIFVSLLTFDSKSMLLQKLQWTRYCWGGEIRKTIGGLFKNWVCACGNLRCSIIFFKLQFSSKTRIRRPAKRPRRLAGNHLI